ncbi:MAG: hypothetical protein SCALA702_02810 [Melioribacteraceae bacterium]|nr:MAG: hypothetical protein SCALA702_02810 [Melioribacteraceae bacterium]
MGVVFAIFLLVIGITISTFWFYSVEIENIKSEKKHLLKKITDLKVSILNTWQKERLSEVRFIANNDQFGRLVNDYFSRPDRRKSGEIDSWLNQLLKNHNYSGYFLYDTDKSKFYSSVKPQYFDDIKIEENEIRDSLNLFYIQKTVSDPLYACISSPVRSSIDQTGFIVLIINLNENILPEIVSLAEFEYPGMMFFADEEMNNILLAGKPDSSYLTTKNKDHIYIDTNDVVETLDEEEQEVLSYSRKIKDTQWVLISRLRLDMVFSSINSFSRLFLIINFILLFAAGVILFYILKKKDLFTEAKIKAEEEKSKTLEKKLNLFSENANDIIYILDIEGNILECNQKAISTYGYSEEELLSMNIRQLKPVEELELTNYYIKQLQKKNKIRFETIHLGKDGRYIDVEISASKVKLNNKVYIQSIVRDNTERKKSERRVLTLNRFYSLLSKTNQTIIKCNDKTELFDRITKICTKYGKFAAAVIVEKDGEKFCLNSISCRHSDETDGMEMVEPVVGGEIILSLKNKSRFVKRNIEQKDEFIRSLSFSDDLKIQSYAVLPVVLDADESPDSFLALFRTGKAGFSREELNLLSELGDDLAYALKAISDANRKEAYEKKIEANEKRLSNMLKNLPGMAYKCKNDEYWTMLYISQGCEKLTGYKYDELLDNKITSFARIIHPNDRERIFEEVNLAIARKQQFDLEYRIITKDKQIKWVNEKGLRTYDEATGEVIEGFIMDVSDIKRAQETIRSSRDFYLYLFNIFPNPIFRTNSEGKVDYVNTAWINFTGSSVEETQGFGWLKNIYFEDYIKFREVYIKSTREKKPYEYELRLKSVNGDHKWVLVMGIPYNDPDGTYSGYLGTIFNIDERKKSEEALDASMKVYRELFDNNPQPMWVYEVASLKILSVNDAATETYQYTKDEFLKLTLLDLRPEREIRRFLQTLKEHELSETWSAGWIHKRKGGSELEVEIKSHEIPSNDEKKVRLVVATDVTERNLAFRLLKESEDKFKTIYETSSIGLFTAREDGTITMANPSFLKMMGYSSLTELTADSMTSPDFYNFTNANYLHEKVLEEGGFRGYETAWINKSGKEIYISLNVEIVEKEGESIFEGTVEDITTRKEIERTLIIAKEEAERSSELKSNFLAQMSHEIRTPINVLISFANLLKDKFPKEQIDDEVNFSFEAIDSSGHRIIRTVDMLLNMSQIQSGAYKPTREKFNLCQEIIYPLFREFKSFADEKGLTLDISCYSEDCTVTGDMYGTKQIFSHIIDNAIKFTNSGIIEISLDENENEYMMLIKDSGVGIADDAINKIFEPFVQEEEGYSRTYDGNGLGLTLVKKYCDLNNYEIIIKSIKNEGTEVKIVIPKDKK